MTGGSLENVRSRVIQKWNSDVAHELERSKVSVGCFDVRSRLVRVGPFPAFQDRRWWTIWIVVWNLGCWAHRFGLIIVYRMRLKSPQVWFARADVRFEACEMQVSYCKWNNSINSKRSHSSITATIDRNAIRKWPSIHQTIQVCECSNPPDDSTYL